MVLAMGMNDVGVNDEMFTEELLDCVVYDMHAVEVNNDTLSDRLAIWG